MDIAAVEDAVDPGEGVVDLRPEGGAGFGDVGVGDQADSLCHGNGPLKRIGYPTRIACYGGD